MLSAEDLPDSSELGLGIGGEIGIYQGIKWEWIYWYDEQGKCYLTPQEELRSAQERNKQLEKHLLSLGINPDTLFLTNS